MGKTKAGGRGKRAQGEQLNVDFGSGGQPTGGAGAFRGPPAGGSVVSEQPRPHFGEEASPITHQAEESKNQVRQVYQMAKPRQETDHSQQKPQRSHPAQEESKADHRKVFRVKPEPQEEGGTDLIVKSAYLEKEERKPKRNKEARQKLQPQVDAALQEQIRTTFDSLPEKSPSGHQEAIEMLWQEMETVLGSFPAHDVAEVETPSHQFGGSLIQPMAPRLRFQQAEDGVSFESQIGRIGGMPQSEVLGKLLTAFDDVVDMRLLDQIFKPSKELLTQDAARDSFTLDTQAILKPKLDRVFQGLCGDTEISSVCLGVEQQETALVHDPLTGLVSQIEFFDQADEAEAQCEQLEDETQIDDLLRMASDPLISMPQETDTLLQAGRKFLGEFRNAVSQQEEPEPLGAAQSIQKKPASHLNQQQSTNPQDEEEEKSDPQSELDPTSPSALADQVIQPKQIQQLGDSSDDELDQIVKGAQKAQNAEEHITQHTQLNEQKQFQAEPSRFHLAVVARERKQESAMTKTLESMDKQQWVIKDNVDMKNFEDLIVEPAMRFNFELDEFQKRAIYRLEQGECVMVAAHTSAGKTAVAEYAIALSRRHMTKTIYTSPIKSLSNQKYRDFKLKFGDVGVLTGDVQLNRDASCLIMTTEVLQSMLYNQVTQLQDVEWVIFDEVHYITDPERGSVWEEVIMKLPDTVSIIMLSATVPNYIEFANWVGRTKQKKVFVQYTDKRPVPLAHHLMLDGKLTVVKEQEQPTMMNVMKPILSQRRQLKDQNAQQKLNDKKKAEKDQKQTQQTSKPPEQDEPEEKQHKIDFKAKAIKAKETSMKRMLAKQTKTSNSGGAGGGGQGPNSGRDKHKQSSFNKTLLQIQKLQLLPCIVFAFSRAGTLTLAQGLDSTVDFSDGYTKGLIRKFVKQKLQRLDPVDRDIPQIRAVTELLYRGIGVHHAGLIQLLKELVEILFSDGYLKVVFATSTFAIGLNLPARCVLFTQLRKFNGTEISTISTSEYLQMAGRAGRRGKDDKGFSIICIDPDLGQIPSFQEMQDLLDSKGVELESQLKIEYQTCLNVLKQDSGEIDSLLANSFFADETMKIKLQNQKKKRQIEPLYEKSKEILCHHGVPEQIDVMFNLIDDLWECCAQINKKQLPSQLQIIEVTTAKHILKPMIVLRVMQEKVLALYVEKFADSWPLQYDVHSGDESMEAIRKKNKPSQIETSAGIFSYEYVEVQAHQISKLYSTAITGFKTLQFLSAHKLNDKQLKGVISEYVGIKQLKEDELKGKAKKAQAVQREELAQVITKMKATQCWSCELLSYHMTQRDKFDYFQGEMSRINQVLEGGLTDKEQEYNTRNQVLVHYKIIDQDLNLLFKGKVASKANNLILTEFFFSGQIAELSDCELLATLSIFNTRERAGRSVPDCSKIYSPAFQKASEFLESETEKLLQLEAEKGVIEHELGSTVQERLNFKFYEMIYDWADQKSFAQVIEGSSIDDGLVIKMIMTVNRTRQRLQEMAAFVGDHSLAERLTSMSELIDRGIVKMQSLYLEVEQEPPRLANHEP